MNSAQRRHEQQKAKNKTKNLLKNIWKEKYLSEDDKVVGIWTSTHRRRCSCYLCRKEKYKRGNKYEDNQY